MLSIIDASYKADYTLDIVFNNNKQETTDIKEFITSTKLMPFKVLEDVNFFKHFTVGYTLK